MSNLVVQPSPTRIWRRVARLLGAVLTVLIVALAVVAIALAVLVKTGPYGERLALGHPIFSVASGSMTPTFRAGDLIVDNPLTATQANHLRPGQIITFVDPVGAPNQPPLLITHRIYSVGTGPGPGGLPEVLYRTKGDANNTPDATPVPASAILGLYSGRIPYGGYVLSILHQPVTFVVLIMIPVTYLVWTETRRRWKALDSHDQQAGRSAPSAPGGPS
jgi:signal peptidase